MSILRMEAYESLDQRLDAVYFAADEEIPFEENPQRFSITDLQEAAWAVRKIQRAESKIAERATYVQQEIERLKQWELGENTSDLRTITTMESLLRPYAIAQIEGQKKKSFSVPGATLGFRSQADEAERDDETTIAWAEGAGMAEYVKTEKKLLWGELKKVCNQYDGYLISPNGEIVPGVTLHARPDTFYVKLKGE